jgi:hydrogenase expression/formation protein HypE
LEINPQKVEAGDKIILSGDLGRHGMAIMAEREGLSFESRIESDSAPLAGIVMKLIEAGIRIHCMRDLTRGGLSSALNEIAEARSIGIRIAEGKIPVREDVRAACEILGLDPLYVANEGRFIAFVPPPDADKALEIVRSFSLGKDAFIIGETEDASPGMVTLMNKIGTNRILDMLTGEQLPRIC